MRPTKGAFDEIKSILSKLDRSIDQARERRLHGDMPEEPRRVTMEPTPAPAHSLPPQPLNPGMGPPPARTPNHAYGRARPLPSERRVGPGQA